MSRSTLVLPFLLLVAFTGCGGSVPVTPVAGKVTFANNKPADNLLLQFLPTSTSGGKSQGGSAVSDGAGQFQVKCDDGRDGLPVGSYIVVVIDNNFNTEEEPGTTPKGKKPLVNRVPQKYLAVDSRNPLTVTVETGKIGYEMKLD